MALDDDHWIAAGSPVSLFFFSLTKPPLRSQGKCRILSSADGGKTWQLTKGSEGKGCLRGLAAHGPKMLVAVGDGGQVLRSDDGGKKWQAVAQKGKNELLAVACSDDGVFVAVGRKGAALASKDAGKTWQPLKLERNDELRAVAAAGKMFCIVGGKGTVLRVLP
jgi:photosystem II stability/assembly factor-like uncharacterized protein